MSDVMLESTQLSVVVDDAFPRVISYTWRETGALLFGESRELTEIEINGVLQRPKVSCERTGNCVAYTLKCPEGMCTISVSLEVCEDVVRFRVTEIKEHRCFPVYVIRIPNHNLVSVRSTQEGARLSCVGGSGLGSIKENFLKVDESQLEINPQTVMYAIVNTNELAATICNTVIHDSARLLCQISQRDHYVQGSIWNGTWIYREFESEIVELPSCDVIVTADRNGDGIVDWQDAAIAYREVMSNPLGSQSVRKWVCSQVAMNFASLAQHPFLRILDNVKKVYLHTDGLPQIVQFKGYQSEGHDSAHPDYGDNMNTRAGGADELRFAMKRMGDYTCLPGVHINATEAYPEAKTYDDELVHQVDGWRWLDQSKAIDKKFDARSGALGKRLKRMKSELPDLKWVYVDVYFGFAWEAWKLAKEICECGWPLFTEVNYVLERHAVWTHVSQEYEKAGLKSKIIRFIHNHEKDMWPRAWEPMLGGCRNLGFMGWHSERDYNAFIENVFTNNLPTKYIQHFPIMNWRDDSVECAENVLITKNENDEVIISRDGNPVAIGTTIFIPWDPEKPEKVYHWNSQGGESTWSLPPSWSNTKTVMLYELTPLGRVFVAKQAVRDNSVTIHARKATPYVVYRKMPEPMKDVMWGEGAGLDDPGFDSYGFEFWKKTALTRKRKHIDVCADDMGNAYLKISGPNDGGVHQEVELTPGTRYSLSVWVEVVGTCKATLSIRFGDGVEYSNFVTKSVVPNYSDNDPKYLTNYQRMKVLFTVPADVCVATIFLNAAESDENCSVHFDDVRLVESHGADTNDHWFFEDFEHCDQGWGPFVYGCKGDVRTHLAERHDPFTNDVINGNWSLKTTDEKPNPSKGADGKTITDGKTGIVLRTLPQTIRFAPRTSYTLTFRYKAERDGQYQVAVGTDDGNAELFRMELSGENLFTHSFKTGEEDDYYIAILKVDNEKGSLVVDDVVIDLMH